MSTSTIFVGHDSREQVAYDVCVHSINMRSNIEVIKLATTDIPEYTRPYDKQSTDFTYSRFMIPYLCNYQGYVIFCDCDFIFLDDPIKLLDYIKPDQAVSVVKHPKYIPNSRNKMDNIVQTTYDKKNWSSLMVFNCGHPDCLYLTPKLINDPDLPGGYFHQFRWTNSVGDIPIDWNCLDNYYYIENPKAIHYTDGGPWFENYRQTMYSNLWYNEYDNMQFNIISE